MRNTVVLIEADEEDLIPEYAHPGDAGADLRSSENTAIIPGEQIMVDCGISIALQPGFVGLIHPRSGLAARHMITVTNAPGTIDSGYRGRVKVMLINHGNEEFLIARGDRIAQLVIQPVTQARFRQVDSINDVGPASQRGEGGFGSTGR